MIAYWLWAAIHEIEASRMELLTFLSGRSWFHMLFALPAILSIIALARTQHRAIRVIAIVCNVLVGTWWTLYSLSASTPAFSVSLLPPISLALAHIVGVIALGVCAAETHKADRTY